MPARKPKGVYARNTPDWFVEAGAGGCALAPAVAAQFGHASLFNDDNAGRSLYVYGLYVINFGATQQDLQLVQGSVGTQVNMGGPIDGSLARGSIPGKIFRGSSAVLQIGGDMGHIGIRSGSMMWPYEWPVAIVPPNSSLVVIADDVNLAFLVSFWWFATNALA